MLNQVSLDLKAAFPEAQGFSRDKGHHIEILQSCKEAKEALFYVEKTIQNNLSRSSSNTWGN